MSVPKIDLGAQAERQIRSGQRFILDAPTSIPALWGADNEVLWAQGESLIITGPQGVGKSLVAQRVMLARHGITDSELLGFPVEATASTGLYLACDRPQQIARSLRRMVNHQHAELLRQRLRFWVGALPFDLVKEPQKLTAFVETLGARTVYIDSLKDIASPLSKDEVGAAINRAFGGVIAAGIELISIHHNRKATAENKKPSTLADVYGSTWITSGAGSVISLWGEAGDPVIELTHLKQPGNDVGPLELQYDHENGTIRREQRADAWSVLQQAAATGTTAVDATTEIYGPKPSRAQNRKGPPQPPSLRRNRQGHRHPQRPAQDRPSRLPPHQPERSRGAPCRPTCRHTRATRAYTNPRKH